MANEESKRHMRSIQKIVMQYTPLTKDARDKGLEEIGCCTRTEEVEIKHQQCYHKVFVNKSVYDSVYYFQQITASLKVRISITKYTQWTAKLSVRSVNKYAMLIFSKCVCLINVAKCRFNPNETIIMYDLSSSNLLSLVYSLFLLTATLV